MGLVTSLRSVATASLFPWYPSTAAVASTAPSADSAMTVSRSYLTSSTLVKSRSVTPWCAGPGHPPPVKDWSKHRSTAPVQHWSNLAVAPPGVPALDTPAGHRRVKAPVNRTGSTLVKSRSGALWFAGPGHPPPVKGAVPPVKRANRSNLAPTTRAGVSAQGGGGGGRAVGAGRQRGGCKAGGTGGVFPSLSVLRTSFHYGKKGTILSPEIESWPVS